MVRYLIKSVKDHDGNLKDERIGRVVYQPRFIGKRLYAEYEDGSPYAGKALLTSNVNKWSKNESKGEIVVETENSIYFFEEVAG